MKLDVEVNEIVLSNVGTTGEFRIRNSAKAFKILSDGLYSNKIRAVIRELSCNAVDSHVAAGKTDVPFVVHLPTLLEPWFSVQDFGTGLDHDQVTNIYTTYFESTKTDSNDFIGALGLGSKSPFSYTENFTVTAVKNGMKRIYSAFINEMGVPSIAEMTSELTDDPNGVEVKFSVNDKYDYDSFRHEAHQVFKWFKNPPTITGAKFTCEAIEYKEQNIAPGVHQLTDTYRSYALMGNIAYPLNKMSEPQKHFGDLAELLNCGLVIEFGIGELDFAASREELSFVPLTIRSIKKKLEELNGILATHFAAKANAIADEWARASFLYQESRSKLYGAAVKKYVADTKFPLFDPNAYYGKKTFVYDVPDLAARDLSIGAFQVYHNSFRGKIGKGSRAGSNGLYVETIHIPVDDDVVFVLNDLKTGCEARARYHFTKNSKSASVYHISHKSDDLAVRQAEYDKLLKELHNPPNVLKASALDKKESKKRQPLSNSGIMTMVEKTQRGYYSRYKKEYTWDQYLPNLDDNTTYYYVCLSNYEPETVAGTQFNASHLRYLMDSCGIPEITGITIFGVRKNRIKDIKDLPNWIWIEDKIKEEVAEIPDSKITSLVSEQMLDHYSNRVYTNETVARLVGPNSDYAKYAKEYAQPVNSSHNDKVTPLIELCAKYGKVVAVDAIKKEIEAAKQLVMAKYPLIQHCSSAPTAQIVDYVKMIDNLESI